MEIELKYEGYIKRQKADVAEVRRLEEKKLPPDADYPSIQGLRMEAREKLRKIRPASVGQASRISGVSPADISRAAHLAGAARGRGGTAVTEFSEKLLQLFAAYEIPASGDQAAALEATRNC